MGGSRVKTGGHLLSPIPNVKSLIFTIGAFPYL